MRSNSVFSHSSSSIFGAPINALGIAQRTMDQAVPAFRGHGLRVAYRVYRALCALGRSEKETRDLCIAALLHDIGAGDNHFASRTEPDVHVHSINGYLLFKYLSPKPALASAVLLHHADCHTLARAPEEHHFAAQIIALADSIDALAAAGLSQRGLAQAIQAKKNVRFFPAIAELCAGGCMPLLASDAAIAADADINAFLFAPMDDHEAITWLKMTVCATELRRSVPTIRAADTLNASRALAECMRFGSADNDAICLGALLSDLGMAGVPDSIFCKRGRLTTGESGVLHNHTRLTDAILHENVCERVRRIAVHHHERLDGSGAFALDGARLSRCERLVAVSHICSALCSKRFNRDAFSSDHARSLLYKMSAGGLLCEESATAAAAHYDDIAVEVADRTRPLRELHAWAVNERARLLLHVGGTGKLEYAEERGAELPRALFGWHDEQVPDAI